MHAFFDLCCHVGVEQINALGTGKKKLVVQLDKMLTRVFCLPSLIRLTVACISWLQPQLQTTMLVHESG